MKSEGKNKRIIIKIITIVLVAIIGICIYKIGAIAYDYYHDRQKYLSIQQEVKTQYGFNIDWEKLKTINKDVTGWIYSDKTIIDYPIVHNAGKAYDYYLHRDIYEEYMYAGSIFQDVRCKGDFSDFNTIIYGHHMKDGSMFQCLTEYTKQSYYEEHPEMIIATPGQAYKLKLFAGEVVKEDDEEVYTPNLGNDIKKQNLIDRLIKNSDFKAPKLEVGANDNIVTLSTCSYGSVSDDESERYIVCGKLEKTELKEIVTTEKQLSLWEIMTVDKLIIAGIAVLLLIIVMVAYAKRKNKKG